MAGVSAILDAVVVGGGPAGSAAATMLAREGHRVVLVDRARFPRDKPCGDYCNPGGTQALQTMGFYDSVRAAGAVPISSMIVRAPSGVGFEAPFPSGHGLLLRRIQLDACLLALAQRQGVDVQEGTHIREIHYGDGYIEAVAGDDRSLRARLLIAADGSHSTIRQRLGLHRGRRGGRYTVGAYFSGIRGRFPRGELHLGMTLYGGVAYFGEGMANVTLALSRSAFRHQRPDEVFRRGLQELPALREALTGAREEGSYRCSGPVDLITHEVAADRVLFVGDAAGQVDPMTGQGISLALRSGVLAGEVAARAFTLGDFSTRVLSLYARARAREVADTLRVAQWIQRLAFKPVLAPFLLKRLATHPTLAREFIGATGDIQPAGPGRVLQFMLRLSVGTDAHGS